MSIVAHWAAQHKGSVCATHPAVPGLILGNRKDDYFLRIFVQSRKLQHDNSQPMLLRGKVALAKEKLCSMVNVVAFFQANLERHGNGQPFLALRVFAGSPPGPNGPAREDLLVALGLHANGALVFGGPLFDIGGGGDDNDETDSDSGMSFEQEGGDDDGDDDDGDDDDGEDDVQIVFESITID